MFPVAYKADRAVIGIHTDNGRVIRMVRRKKSRGNTFCQAQDLSAVQHKRVFFRAQDVAAGRAAKPQELGAGHRVTYTIPIYSSRDLVLAPLTPSCVPFGRRRFNSNNNPNGLEVLVLWGLLCYEAQSCVLYSRLIVICKSRRVFRHP